MTSSDKKLTSSLIVNLFIFAMMARIFAAPLLGYPSNFAPVDALAIFSGAYLMRRTAFILVLLTVWCSDLLINHLYFAHWTLFYPGFYWQYVSYLLIVLFGCLLKNNIKPLNIAMTTVLSATLFFIISNLGVWTSGLLYPRTLIGLYDCYVAAIPFFKHTMLSDLCYVTVLFGGYAWASQKFNTMRIVKTI